MPVSSAHPLTQELLTAGLIPPQCIHWELHVPVGGAVRIVAECWASEEQYAQIVALLKTHNESLEHRIEIVDRRSLSSTP